MVLADGERHFLLKEFTQFTIFQTRFPRRYPLNPVALQLRVSSFCFRTLPPVHRGLTLERIVPEAAFLAPEALLADLSFPNRFLWEKQRERERERES